jgi:hypothetical protein
MQNRLVAESTYWGLRGEFKKEPPNFRQVGMALTFRTLIAGALVLLFGAAPAYSPG